MKVIFGNNLTAFCYKSFKLYDSYNDKNDANN